MDRFAQYGNSEKLASLVSNFNVNETPMKDRLAAKMSRFKTARNENPRPNLNEYIHIP